MRNVTFEKQADGTIQAKVELTSDQWELFDTATKSVVNDLNRALEKGLNKAGVTNSSLQKAMEGVLKKHSKHGALALSAYYLIDDVFSAYRQAINQ